MKYPQSEFGITSIVMKFISSVVSIALPCRVLVV